MKNSIFLVDAFLSCNCRQVSHMHFLNENIFGTLIITYFLLWYSWKIILMLKIIKFNPRLPNYFNVRKRCNPLNRHLQALGLDVVLVTPFFHKICPPECLHHCSITCMILGMCVCVYTYIGIYMFYAYIFEIYAFAQVYSVLSWESQISNFMDALDLWVGD